MDTNLIKLLSRVISTVMVLTLSVGFLGRSVFSVQAAPGDTTCVSVNPSGMSGNDYSNHANISPDGRYVVFESVATNLISGGSAAGIFVRDLQTNQTTRLPIDGEAPVISRGGRYVAFTSWVLGETADTSMSDVFMYDRQTGATTKVSVDSSGVQGNGWSDGPAISDDGRYIVFHSDASNLVAGDTNAAGDIFVRDLQTGILERVSIATGGSQADSGSSDPSISADGRIVVFSSNATNLVSGDSNGKSDIFVRDRTTGVTTRASVNSSGVEANLGASDASISGNGRFVSFSSYSSNLMDEDSLGFEHLYVRDLQAGITSIMSTDSAGYQLIGNSESSVISADGRYVAFQFQEKGLSLPIFVIDVHDRLTGSTSTVVGRYNSSDSSSGSPSISSDGRLIAFSSGGALVSGDTNGKADVYLKEMAYPADLVPTVSSTGELSGRYPTPATVTFGVTFSEIVTGVTVDDFLLTMGGGVSGATVTNVRRAGSTSTSLGNEYRVDVNTGSGDGTLRLDVIDNDSIVDISGNPLGGTGSGNGTFNTGAVYVVDKNVPAVVSSVRLDPNPASAAYVNFAVTFSEDVTGVDALDFNPYPTSGNLSGFGVSEVTGSGRTYNVKVGSGSGEGTLKLNVIDNDSIHDLNNNPFGGVGPDNGTFTSGEEYTIVRIPAVFSILRVDPNPTATDTVNFIVTFTKPVTGVDLGDFSLTTKGKISGAAITGITGPGSNNDYTVTVGTGSGDGTLRLDVVDNDSIIDAGGIPLGSTGFGNGNYTNGDSYTVDKTQTRTFTETFRSNGSNDGWVLESNENSNLGGSRNSTAQTFIIGDDENNRQYRSILHFPTYYLPDNAVITQAVLIIKSQGVVGTNPFTTHQNIAIDIRGGYFGSSGLFGLNSLDLADFQAPADMNSAGIIQNNPVSGWYWALLDSKSYPFINLTGVTQLRLMFQLDDNNDLGADYLAFFSGNYVVVSDRPQLLIEYHTLR
jgi:Tol biopolymer transport system component